VISVQISATETDYFVEWFVEKPLGCSVTIKDICLLIYQKHRQFVIFDVISEDFGRITILPVIVTL